MRMKYSNSNVSENWNIVFFKEKKKSAKKPYEGTKWEIVKPSGENLLNIKDMVNNLLNKKIKI